MDNLNSLLNSFLIDSESRGVGNHESTQFILVLLGLESQISQIDFSGLLISLDGDYIKSNEVSTSWVCSVGGRGNEAEVSVSLSDALQIQFNSTETSILSGGS